MPKYRVFHFGGCDQLMFRVTVTEQDLPLSSLAFHGEER